MRTIKRFSVVTLLAISAAFMLAACQSRESNQAVQQKSALKQNIQSSIDDIDNQMENLRTSLQTPAEQQPQSGRNDNNNNSGIVNDRQNKIQDQLADLEDYRDKFTEKLNQIETVSSDEWQNFQQDVNDLQNDYRQSLQDYASDVSEGQSNDGNMMDGASDAERGNSGSSGTGTGMGGGTGTGTGTGGSGTGTGTGTGTGSGGM